MYLNIIHIRVFRLDIHGTLLGLASRQHKWIQKRESIDTRRKTSWQEIYGYTRHV